MVDNRKRRVNPALLLGGGEESVSQPGLVESGDFVKPRVMRNFLPVKDEGSVPEGKQVVSDDVSVVGEDSSPVKGKRAPAELLRLDDDEPTVDDLAGLGLSRQGRRGDAVPLKDEEVNVSEVSEGVSSDVGERVQLDTFNAGEGAVINLVTGEVLEGEEPEIEGDESGSGLLVDVTDEPSVDDLAGLGFSRTSRRDVSISPEEAPEVVEPETGVDESLFAARKVERERKVVDTDETVSGEVEFIESAAPVRRVNPLFLGNDAEPVKPRKKPVNPSDVLGDSEKQGADEPKRVRRVNPSFMLEKEATKPARPGFLDTGRAPVRRGNQEHVDEGGTFAASDEDRMRKLFVNRSDAKPRSVYTKRVNPQVEAEDWDDDSEGVSAGLGGEVDEGKRKRADHKGFHFRERDALILRFLARYRYAYVDQIARLVDSTPRNVMSRLRVLEKRGFIRRESVTGTQYLWTTRKAGNLLVDIGFKEIKKGNISYATISHTIGLANLGVEFERELGGKDLLGEGKGVEDWEPNLNRWKLGVWGHPDGKGYGEMTVTEREIRQGQTRWRGNRDTGEMRNLVMKAVANPSGPECEEGNEGLFVVYGLQGGEHVPDFVIARERNAQGGVENIAVELELTEKTNADWRKIIRNYRDNGQMFKKVYYFTHKKAIANALRKIIETEGMEDRVILRKYAPTSGRMPFWG